MKKLRKRFLTLAIACVMAMAMAVPAFAVNYSSNTLPSWTLVLINKYGYLTAATFGNAGSNDPVYGWSQLVDSNESQAGSQMWVFSEYNNCYVIKPSTNRALSINVYRSGSWPCTVFSLADNSYLDYAVKITIPDASKNISNIQLAYRSGYRLTVSNTSAYKFSTGSGYVVNWLNGTNTGRQEWVFTTPN